jgi:hypothetical protein
MNDVTVYQGKAWPHKGLTSLEFMLVSFVGSGCVN